MPTSEELRTFKRCGAEVPHHAVARTHTETIASTRHVGSNFGFRIAFSEDTLAALVDRAKSGNNAAFEELLVVLRPRAMATALRVLHNRDDAEDAVQDAFLKVWRCLGTFEGRSLFPTWIHRIVTNASLDLLRRNTNRSETVERGGSVKTMVCDKEPSTQRTPESDLCDYEIHLLVRSAVAGLPSMHRRTVELREFDDCSYQEMAEIIQCPVGTVMSRLHHARNRLASELRAPLGESFRCYAA